MNDNTLETTKKRNGNAKTELGRTSIKNQQHIRSSKLFNGRLVWHLIRPLVSTSLINRLSEIQVVIKMISVPEVGRQSILTRFLGLLKLHAAFVARRNKSAFFTEGPGWGWQVWYWNKLLPTRYIRGYPRGGTPSKRPLYVLTPKPLLKGHTKMDFTLWKHIKLHCHPEPFRDICHWKATTKCFIKINYSFECSYLSSGFSGFRTILELRRVVSELESECALALLRNLWNTRIRGTQREYSSKPLKHSIVKCI